MNTPIRPEQWRLILCSREWNTRSLLLFSLMLCTEIECLAAGEEAGFTYEDLRTITR